MPRYCSAKKLLPLFRKKIDESPNGADEEVIADEGQMILLLSNIGNEHPEITWRCDACGCERPDDKISVYSSQVGEFTQNVKYCNDNPCCTEKALDIKLVSDK